MANGEVMFVDNRRGTISSQTCIPCNSTPVYGTDTIPRWFKRGLRKYDPHHGCRYIQEIDYFLERKGFKKEKPHIHLFDHMGDTIVNGFHAFVTEPYYRGCPECWELALDVAGIIDCESLISLYTWHGYGTIRFTWLSHEPPTKKLQRFTELSNIAVVIAKELLPVASDDKSEFWIPFGRRLRSAVPSITSDEWESARCAAESLLQYFVHCS